MTLRDTTFLRQITVLNNLLQCHAKILFERVHLKVHPFIAPHIKY